MNYTINQNMTLSLSDMNINIMARIKTIMIGLPYNDFLIKE